VSIGPLTAQLTDLLISGELRQARRLGLPEGFQTILVIGGPGPAWSPIKLRNVHLTCTPEGYQKDTGSVTEFWQESHGIALQLCPHAGRIPEGYRKGVENSRFTLGITIIQSYIQRDTSHASSLLISSIFALSPCPPHDKFVITGELLSSSVDRCRELEGANFREGHTRRGSQ
jgi:hypothetical protein